MSMDDVALSSAPVPYERLTDLGYDAEADKSPELKQQEEAQRQEDINLAALRDHPGWKQIRKQMVKDIEGFRTLSNLKIKEYTDSELGQVARTELQVAEKLQGYLSKIDQAVEAVRTNGK